jgi:hypothetical protein
MVDFDALNVAVNAAFGEPATFTPKGGTPMPVSGVFFDGYTHDVNLGDGSIGVNTVKPVFAVRAALFAGRLPKQGDGLWIASVNTIYAIKDPQPDGVGEIRLHLQKVSSP